MDLGTGIFLSTLVFSGVVLYGITKDRWNWRRLVKRTAILCFGLILLGAATDGGVYLYNQSRPTVARQTQYAGLRLGMSKNEVLYIKGYPSKVLTEDVFDSKLRDFIPALDTNKLENGKSARDYRDWSYNGHKHSISIVFNDAGAVVSIQCFSEDKLGHCPPIAEIRDGDYEKRVLRMLGENPQAELSGVTKSLTYPAFGLRLALAKQQVYMLEVYSAGLVRPQRPVVDSIARTYRGRDLEQATAVERAGQATRDSAAANEKARTEEINAEEVRKRIEELGKALKEASERPPESKAEAKPEWKPEPTPAVATAMDTPPTAKEQSSPEAAAPPREPLPSPLAASLKKYVGTKAAIYVLDEVPDGPAVGSAILGPLTEAGWAPLTWTWTGVSGITGVVVLIKDDIDPATNEAASALVNALHLTGFNAVKGDWPADWRRFRGKLNGPHISSPTDAPIRIVVGSKPR